MSLLTYQSLPCDLSRRLTAIVFAPLEHANFVPAKDKKGQEAKRFGVLLSGKHMPPLRACFCSAWNLVAR